MCLDDYRGCMPKLRHYDHLNTACFVTFSCCHRHKLFISPTVIELFLDTLKAIRRERALRIFGYVVMPEQVHLILHPPDSLKLGSVIAELKSKSASRIIAESLIELPCDCRIMKSGHERRAFWQPRRYDHNCRTPDTAIEKINYCHTNPVKRGLVAEPAQWRWSSYNWYAGMSDVPLEMDVVEA
jgi:putative transposase